VSESEIEPGAAFPGESEAYRAARNRLLAAEIELRRSTESVAQLRRALPPGGPIPEDYVFQEATGVDGSQQRIKLSELFAPGKDTLVVYSYMFGPEMEQPCPSCSSIIDSLDGAALHLEQRLNLVVVAKSPAERIADFARKRGWRHLRFLSSHGTTFNRDYLAETPEGYQMPILHVFRKDADSGEVRHFWSSEMATNDPGQEPRSIDFIWPLWNVLDATPEGRGTDGDFPRLTYDEG